MDHEYLYTDPDTEEEVIYTVRCGYLGFGSKDQYTFLKPEELPYAWRIPAFRMGKYDDNDFFKGDFTKYIGNGGRNFLLTDIRFMLIRNSGDHVSSLLIIHDDLIILISKHQETDEGKIPNVKFDSSKDCDIIRRLTNIKTYEDAIEELMDPANALPKSE